MTRTSAPDAIAQPDLSQGKPRLPNRKIQKLGATSSSVPDATPNAMSDAFPDAFPNNNFKGETKTRFHLVSDESILIRPHP